MRTRHSERGAILVYVAITILALMGFSAFVVDYGVFWLARHQAQNAADAGAMAGAIARLFDEPDSPVTITSGSVSAAAAANSIFGEPPAVEVSDVDPCPAWAAPHGNACVRVAVFRDAAHGNPLPSYFAPIFRMAAPGVQAAATAQRRAANSTNCLKPIMLPDLGGFYAVPPRPWSDRPGYTLNSIGTQILLNPAVTNQSLPGFFAEFDAGQGSGNIQSGIGEPCPSSYGSHSLYETVNTFASHQPGGAAGAALLGLEDVIALDPGAYWDSGVNAVRGSCAPACGAFSPRIINMMLFNPAAAPGGTLYIRDIMSVFVDQVTAGIGYVYITPSVGKITNGDMPLTNAGFLNVVAMVR